MKRMVSFLVVVAVTFYLSVIYKSRGLIFLGYAEVSAVFLLLIYNIIGMRRLRISLEAPLGITEHGKRVPVTIKIQNFSGLPTGKVGIQVMEHYTFYGKKRKTFFYESSGGRKYGEEYSAAVIRTWWSPAYTGKVVMSVRKVRCFDLLGAIYLPLPKSAYSGSEVITVLPSVYQVPVDVGDTVKNFAAEQERYLLYDTEEMVAEQFQIRGYQPGDRLRSIHWKLSAKEDELMVRDYQPVKRCPVLFFLDVTGEVGRREVRGRELLKSREMFFTVMVSLSDSMVKHGCKHYVIWYDGRVQDVVRHQVADEEEIYTLLAMVNDIAGTPEGFDIQEEYYDKYREKSYASKLVLNSSLCLTCNDEQVINYREQDLEGSLVSQIVYL